MGVRDDGKEVNNIDTPCKNNPYEFIQVMKTVLENGHISSTLANWIDLIFGYKSRGKDAESANNIFKEMAYQDSKKVDLKSGKI